MTLAKAHPTSPPFVLYFEKRNSVKYNLGQHLSHAANGFRFSSSFPPGPAGKRKAWLLCLQSPHWIGCPRGMWGVHSLRWLRYQLPGYTVNEGAMPASSMWCMGRPAFLRQMKGPSTSPADEYRSWPGKSVRRCQSRRCRSVTPKPKRL